jgi:PKD repeat protein
MLSHTSASLRTGIVRVALVAAMLIATLAIGTSTASAHYGHHWSGHENQSWHSWHTWWWSSHHGQCNRTPVPIAAFTATPESTFVGEAVAFDASGTSGGVVKDWHGDDVVGVVTKYDWSFGDGSAATSDLPTTAHSYSEPGTYVVKLTATNDANKTSSITKSVSVSPLPVPTASFTHDPQAPLATHEVGFDASASTGGESNGRVGTIVSYSWDFGDGAVVVPAEAEAANPLASHVFAEAGAYVVTLTVTNDSGKTATATETLEVAPLPKPQPTASFTLSPSSPVAERSVAYDGSASSGGATPDAVGTIVSYDWDFGDGQQGTGVTVDHTFASEGTYVVSLTVTNDAGESDTASQSIVVAPAPPPYEPGDEQSPFSTDDAAPYAVSSLSTQSLVTSTKSSRGLKVGVAVSFTLPDDSDSASACDGSAKIAVSSAGQRKVSSSAALGASANGCQLRFKMNLPKGYAGKKAKFAFAFAGNDAIAPWSLTRKLVVK